MSQILISIPSHGRYEVITDFFSLVPIFFWNSMTLSEGFISGRVLKMRQKLWEEVIWDIATCQTQLQTFQITTIMDTFIFLTTTPPCLFFSDFDFPGRVSNSTWATQNSTSTLPDFVDQTERSAFQKLAQTIVLPSVNIEEELFDCHHSVPTVRIRVKFR